MVQIITDEAKLHHIKGSQIIQIKHKITQYYVQEKPIMEVQRNEKHN